MKKIIFTLSCSLMLLNLNAQKNINLNLNHVWNNNVFNYGQQYTDVSGNKIEITRVQYYLSGINLVHDEGQNTSPSETFLLASANMTSYSLGTADFNSLEGINFDLGIDAVTNHLDPGFYAPTNPLALQNPSMHWGWSAGYRFVVIEGKVDTNGDNVVETTFEFHVTANDNYLTPVNYIVTPGSVNGNDVTIDIYVNIADWLADIDLTTAGYNHGSFPLNGEIMVNTNRTVVFDTQIPLGISDNEKALNNVHFDYSLPYAPTIFYKFPTANEVAISITDLNGKVIKNEEGLGREGNYFINTELASGTYIAVFSIDNNVKVTEKFVVSN